MPSTSFRFQSIFRACFSKKQKKKEKKKKQNKTEQEKQEKKERKPKDEEKKKHDHTRTKAVFLGTNVAWGSRHEPKQLCFLSFSLAHVPFLLLSLSLIDKDKANLFGKQGHGWCRQTLLLHAPLRCPFPQYFVFLSQLLQQNQRSSVRCLSTAL